MIRPVNSPARLPAFEEGRDVLTSGPPGAGSSSTGSGGTSGAPGGYRVQGNKLQLQNLRQCFDYIMFGDHGFLGFFAL